MLYEAYVDLIS